MQKHFLTIALAPVATLAAVSLTASDAHAVCTFSGGGPNLSVNCSNEVDATLTYDPSFQTLTLTDNTTVGLPTTAPTDLSGNNTIFLDGTTFVTSGNLSGLTVEETLPRFGTTGFIDLREGDDVVDVRGGNIDGTIFGGPGDDTYSITAPPVPGRDDVRFLDALADNAVNGVEFFGGDGDDLIIIGPNTATFFRSFGEAGNDRFDIAGTVGVPLNPAFTNPSPVGLSGGDDDDSFLIRDTATVLGDIDGGTGTDDILVRGGTISGTIVNFEEVTFNGANEENPFRGTFSVQGPEEGAGFLDVTVRDATFVDPVNGTSFQFNGNIGNLNVTNASFFASDGPATGTVENLSVVNSTIEIRNSVVIDRLDGSFTPVSVTGSTISLIDGFTDDTLAVGNLTASGSTFGVDVDRFANDADDIFIDGTFTQGAQGNTLLVNFINEVESPGLDEEVVSPGLEEPISPGLVDATTGTQVIPIIVSDDDDPTGAVPVPEEVFAAMRVTPDLMTSLTVLQKGNNFFLEIGDAGEGIVTNPTGPSTSTSANFANNAVQDVVQDGVDRAVGFGAPQAGVAITPTFGVFANGSAGQVWHDGFDVSGPNFSGTTPSFRADNVSVIGTGELDVSAEFGLEDIGVRASLFGGYARTDVDLSTVIPEVGISPFRGSAVNDAGVVGASVLGSQIVGLGNLNYALLAVAGFFGNTDVVIANNGASGSYDTQGVIVTVKGGRNIAVSDDIRLDLRVGGAFAGFFGDGFTDSLGNEFGETRTTFGLLSFEPGISTVVPVGNYLLQPFGRFLLQGRVGYENEAELTAGTFEFDDADFTIGLQLGANIKFNEVVSAGANIDVRANEDQQSILGKLAVKFTIPRS